MLRFYFHPTPNPMKVALFLEESGLPYELVPVDTFKGEQHEAAYRAINPNGKVPAIDDDGTIVFDSAAILLYLAEKTGAFLPPPQQRGELLSWLMFIATGLSPFSGQAVHFLRHAPERIPYATNRYLKEAERHYQVLETRLAGRPFIIGDAYTIVDMAAWGWFNFAGAIFGPPGLAAYPNVQRLFQAISARPAAQRALALKSRLALKHELDDEARRVLFPQNVAAGG